VIQSINLLLGFIHCGDFSFQLQILDLCVFQPNILTNGSNCFQCLRLAFSPIAFLLVINGLPIPMLAYINHSFADDTVLELQ